MWAVVRLLRRLLALALAAGLTLMNVQAAELHVHATADRIDETHHHGPASHHHDEVEHRSPVVTEVGAVDGDETVVHVSLVAASTQPVKPFPAAYEAAPLFAQGLPSIVKGARIVARAHGPPSLVQPSLRAPPAFLSL
jgi:hypothetical protein